MFSNKMKFAVAVGVVSFVALTIYGAVKKSKNKSTDTEPADDSKQEAQQETEVEFSDDFKCLLKAAKPIHFSESWHNGTGYFDGCYSDTTVQDGVWKCISDDNRVLIIVKKGKNVTTIFQRYESKDGITIAGNGVVMSIDEALKYASV